MGIQNTVARFALAFVAVLALWVGLGGCQSEGKVQPEGSVRLRINLLMDGAPLELGRRYRNAAANEFTVEDFRFYLSNVRLSNTATDQAFAQPESYHLVKRSEQSATFDIELKNVPAAAYNRLEFAVGVDKARNLSLDQVGDLDPSNNMAWDWNTGYKFILLEGRFFPSATLPPRGLVFHIGGEANYRSIALPLLRNGQAALQVEGGGSATIELNAEVNAMFNSTPPIDFNQTNNVMFGEAASRIADNYARNMFGVAAVR